MCGLCDYESLEIISKFPYKIKFKYVFKIFQILDILCLKIVISDLPRFSWVFLIDSVGNLSCKCEMGFTVKLMVVDRDSITGTELICSRDGAGGTVWKSRWGAGQQAFHGGLGCAVGDAGLWLSLCCSRWLESGYWNLEILVGLACAREHFLFLRSSDWGDNPSLADFLVGSHN